MRAIALACLVAAPALAFPVTVDGLPTEWSTRTTANENQGIVIRSSNGGELLFSDVAADQRTDLGAATELDLRRVQVTGDATNLYILARTAAAVGALVPQLQVSIDTDRIIGNGQDFLGGLGDTRVTDSARWEFLVQTMFGSGGSVRVLDTAYNPTGSASAVRAGDTIEIAVPWSTLGLTGPPAAPLRITASIYAANGSDNTVDIGGSGVSNAVDAIGNCGNPQFAAPFPNAFGCDLSDQIINWFADVWFQPSGDVYSPLLVTHFVANTTTEWLTIRNVSPATINLAGIKVGDEETADQGEGMRSLPASTLASGATYVVAFSGTAYQTRYGELPDAEMTSTLPAVPDAPAYALWTNAPFALANGGDEVVLLDGSDVLLDVVVYGTGAYPGVTTRPGTPLLEEVLVRTPFTQDTDNCALDFVGAAGCVTVASCAGGAACGTCTGHACGAQPSGTSCADSNVCNGSETCNGAGVCQPGTPLVCNDGNACTADSCNAVTGCEVAFEMPGTLCPDGDLCTGDETCDGVGVCVAGTPLVCGDSNPCTVDSCNAVSGCVNAAGNAGATCRASAGVCDPLEQCDGTTTACPADLLLASGVCRASSGICDAAESCNGASAACPVDQFVAAGTECRASGGVCDFAEACTGTDSACPANLFVPSGTMCRASGGVCDVAESCDGSGAACPADALAPSTTPCRAASGVCDVAESCTGTTPACPADVLAPSTTVCRAASDVCDAPESCTGASNTCPADLLAGTSTVCRVSAGLCDVAESCSGTSNACPADGFSPASTVCRAASGVCDVAESCTGSGAVCPVDAFAANGTACNDTLTCNGAERCMSGSCNAGTAPDCNDNNVCTMDMCGEPAGCSNMRFPGCCVTVADCDDNDACTTDGCPAAGQMCAHVPIPGCSDAGIDAGADAGIDGGIDGGTGGGAGGGSGTAGGGATAGGSGTAGGGATAGGSGTAGGAGTAGGMSTPGDVTGGCGCGSTDGLAVLAFAALLLLRRRRLDPRVSRVTACDP